MVYAQVTISRRGHTRNSRRHWLWSTCGSAEPQVLSTSLESSLHEKRSSLLFEDPLIVQSLLSSYIIGIKTSSSPKLKKIMHKSLMLKIIISQHLKTWTAHGASHFNAYVPYKCRPVWQVHSLLPDHGGWSTWQPGMSFLQQLAGSNSAELGQAQWEQDHLDWNVWFLLRKGLQMKIQRNSPWPDGVEEFSKISTIHQFQHNL